METKQQILDFIKESNRIEGIIRTPTKAEIDEYKRFMGLNKIAIEDMIQFVAVYQPRAELRDRKGLSVIIGNHIPPPGDITIRTRLMDILTDAYIERYNSRWAYLLHQRYELLHPFTDCNGRSGRMLWRWMMKGAALGFLHHWYYQSLDNWRK